MSRASSRCVTVQLPAVKVRSGLGPAVQGGAGPRATPGDRAPGAGTEEEATQAERPGLADNDHGERAQAGWMSPRYGHLSVYALLADGTTVQIRPVGAADFDAVKAMHEAMSPDNAYLRFFSISRLAAEQEARRVTRAPGPDHAALLAVYDGQVVGLASYEVDRGDGKTAEVAFAVSDTMHHRGIATLLLEHLVSLARASQLEALTAETLQENTGMLRVFSEAGLPVLSKREDGVVAITHPAAPRRHQQAAGGLPGHGGGARAVRQRRQPAAGIRARLRRGDRGEQAPGDGRPFGPGQHQGRRIRREALRGEPQRASRSAASRASPTSRACRRRPTSPCSRCRRWRWSAPRRRAVSAACAASWC